MSTRAAAWAAAFLALIAVLWPRITLHAGPVPVAMPTGALIIAALAMAILGLGWLACRNIRSRPRYRLEPA